MSARTAASIYYLFGAPHTPTCRFGKGGELERLERAAENQSIRPHAHACSAVHFVPPLSRVSLSHLFALASTSDLHPTSRIPHTLTPSAGFDGHLRHPSTRWAIPPPRARKNPASLWFFSSILLMRSGFCGFHRHAHQRGIPRWHPCGGV